MKKFVQICAESPWKMLSLLLLASLLCRWPSLFIPYLDIDEILWGLHANAIVSGGIPYHAMMGEKPPLLYLTYAGIFALFGRHNYFAIHVLGIVWASVTGLCLFALTKKATESKETSFAAALFYVVFSSAPGFRMLATTGELLMNLPLVLSCLIFWRWREKLTIINLALIGFVATIAAFFRQQSLIHLGVFGFFAIALFFKERTKQNALFVLKSALGLTTGTALAIAICLVYVLSAGAWTDFMIWVVNHNFSYIKSGFLNHHVLRNFSLHTGHVLATTLPLWILAIMRCGKILKRLSTTWDRKIEFEILMLLYLVLSLVATIPGGRFFPHYFLQAFPPLCVLAVLEWRELFVLLRLNFFQKTLKALPLIFLCLVLIKTCLTRAEMSLDHSDDYAPSNQTVGTYIKQHTNPDATIFIWGWSQGIYYYAGRDPAARFISSDFLTGRSPSQDNNTAKDTSGNITPGSWNMLFEDFAKHKPRYIIDTSPKNPDYKIYPIKNFPLLADFLKNYYTYETQIEGVDLYRLKETP